MINQRKRRFAPLFLLLAMLWTMAGCVREDSADCRTPFRFMVKAYDADRVTELTNASVADVVLYIFDKDNLFAKEIETTVGSTIEIIAPAGDQFTVVALGNLGGGNQTRPVFNVGDHISSRSVELITTRATKTYQAPDDLFMGSVIVSKETYASGSGQIIPMYRKTGKMNITIRGLKQYFSFADNDFSIEANSTRRAISFDGSQAVGAVSYLPTGTFNASGEFIVPSFNLFAASDITIDIYHGSILLTTISTINGTDPITVTEGMTTNVLISYLGSINVTVAITNWGTEAVWKQYN